MCHTDLVHVVNRVDDLPEEHSRCALFENLTPIQKTIHIATRTVFEEDEEEVLILLMEYEKVVVERFSFLTIQSTSLLIFG